VPVNTGKKSRQKPDTGIFFRDPVPVRTGINTGTIPVLTDLPVFTGIHRYVPVLTGIYRYYRYAPVQLQPSPYIQTKYLLSQTNLQNIRIELTDNFNRPIDLNGIPFLLNLKCEIVKNTSYDIPTGVDPRQSSTASSSIEQTPLERIMENSSIIDRPSPIDLNNLVEINIIQKMIPELSTKKKAKNNI